MDRFELSNWLLQVLEKVFVSRNYSLELLPEFVAVERPKNKIHGDYSTNIAMQKGKALGVPPKELADSIVAEMEQDTCFTNVSAAGPGFINFSISLSAQNEVLNLIATQKADFGKGNTYLGKKINLEFVSANPTGPIHLGGARWAAVGDALSRVLKFQGGEVTKEYYFNDHGSQIDRFTDSLVAAAKGEAVPEDGYAGVYINDIAQEILANNPNVLQKPIAEVREVFRSQGGAKMFAQIKASLHNFRTDFDVYTHENSLFENGTVEASLNTLKDNGNLVYKEGAWWLLSSKFGDDKDRVVIKSNGEYSYLAGDIGYFADKIKRGFELCVMMLGADHHGYIARLKAAAAALGENPDTLEILIGQLVNLLKAGQPVRMSKRAGNIVTMDDLVEYVGVDAARYSLIRSSVDTSLDIDLDLLTKASNDNPVYYVQYAHARLASLLRTAVEHNFIEKNADMATLNAANLGLLDKEGEGELIRNLAQFPETVLLAADNREPHRIARYLENLASSLHKFYAESRVLPVQESEFTDLNRARLFLCAGAKQVFANGLNLLGIEAPNRM